ncbi:fibronectin type III domain-containing protein [Treponema denticola]|uniref:fibronectin type III domain-containing protein n=1 Tax=Treponema denticola TaxID=158 RepID=UPI0020A5317D|nr:fibronectin type III domain-containing protein [Treponema denticola]UTC92337.1 fibronectin type III domain-containing protein [Treponema denticola]
MEDKRIFTRNLVILFLLLLFPLGVFAQKVEDKNQNAEKNNEVKKNYIIETEGKKAVFYQTLSWENVEGILHFEFELEKKEKNGKWVIIDKKKLKKNSLDVSLPAGKYRYRIKVINLLGQVDAVSADRYFDILVAYQPETSSVSPAAIYFDEEYSDVVSLSGKNFREETTFALQKEGGAPIFGKILEISPDGTKAKISFNMLRINPGQYEFVVTDPSGLKDSKQKMTFKFQKPIDIYLSGGYAFNGFAGNKLFKEYFGKDFAALSGVLRFSFVPIKRSYGNFGFNFTGSGMYLRKKDSDYTLSAGLLLAGIQAVYMKPIIRHRLNFDAHLGFGTAFVVNTQFVFPEFKSPKSWYWGLTMNLGTALQVYVYKKLYIEVNLDHIIPFRTGFPKYIVQPSLSVGWEF